MELRDTHISDPELSKLALMFLGSESLLTANYLGLERVEALNISHNLRGVSHAVMSEYLTRWRNRHQDGTLNVRQKLIAILDLISSEQSWFSREQYSFLWSGGSTAIQETNSGPSGGNGGPVNAVGYQQRPCIEYQRNPYPQTARIQMEPSQKNADHRLLDKVARKITNWDDFHTLGLWLYCSKDDVTRLQNENQSIVTASNKVLSSWYDSCTLPNQEKWTMLKVALLELGKDGCVKDLGIYALCGDRQIGLGAEGGGDGPSVPAGGLCAEGARNSGPSQPMSESSSHLKTASGACPEGGLGAARSEGLTAHAQNVPQSASNTKSGLLSGCTVQKSGKKSATAQGENKKEALENFSRKWRSTPNKSYPEGIPVSNETALHALADGNCLSYGWLNYEKMKESTADSSNNNKPVVVAILDTGIYTQHAQLDGVVKASFNFVRDRPGVSLAASSQMDLEMDHFNHGTMVAGLIKRYGPVNLHILNYKVIPTKFEEQEGVIHITKPEGIIEDVIAALEHITSLDGTPQQVDIVNMSFGNKEWQGSLDEKLHEMAKNKVLIAAAGNEGERCNNTVEYPAKYGSVICVGACDDHGGLLGISARGREIDFLCPGQQIMSTCGKMLTPGAIEPQEFVTNGTSFAAPFATAVAANVIAAIPDVYRPACTRTSAMYNILSKMCKGYDRYETDKGYGVLKPEKFFEKMAGLGRILKEDHLIPPNL